MCGATPLPLELAQPQGSTFEQLMSPPLFKWWLPLLYLVPPQPPHPHTNRPATVGPQVTEHVETWNVSGAQAIAQILRPSTVPRDEG